MPHIMRTRAATALATVLLTTAATVGAVASPAAAEVIADGPLINTTSGRCMTVSSGGVPTMTTTCPDQPSHRWTYRWDQPTNTRSLHHEGTGRCLSEVSIGVVRLEACDIRDRRQNWPPRVSPYSIIFRTDDTVRSLADDSGVVRTMSGGPVTWRMWR